MNEPNDNPVPQTTPAANARKKRAVRVTKPRVMDPEILKLRAVHKINVDKLRSQRASERILRVILEKRFPKLTLEDKETLFAALSKFCTPGLPLDKSSAQ